jgi:hypothetical protein
MLGMPRKHVLRNCQSLVFALYTHLSWTWTLSSKVSAVIDMMIPRMDVVSFNYIYIYIYIYEAEPLVELRFTSYLFFSMNMLTTIYTSS